MCDRPTIDSKKIVSRHSQLGSEGVVQAIYATGKPEGKLITCFKDQEIVVF